MTDLYIEKLNEVHMCLHCDDSIAMEINDYFAFFAKNYRHMPKFKMGMWDGKIRMFNLVTHKMHLGLMREVIKFGLDRGYKMGMDDDLKPEPFDFDADEYTESFNLAFDPYDYQLNAIEMILKHRRRMILSPTSSGKSFIIYAAVRQLVESGKRVLLVVPTTSLVEQMVGDFADYSSDNEFDADAECHKIYAGKDKDSTKAITVTTWQSVYKLPQAWFSDYDAVFVDEAHLATAESITKLMEKCTNAEYRIGLTGTIEDTKTHKLSLTGLFGPVYETITTKELMDRGFVSKLAIRALIHNHTDVNRKLVSGMDYPNEIDHIVSDVDRNRFICKLALSQKGNTLILFNLVEKHGMPLQTMLEELNTAGKKIFFVHGDVDASVREAIRAYTEIHSDVIILASYGTFSTGISIKNLENVVFAHPYKSKIKILQSIGRVLRKSKYSDSATLFDIVDDFKWKSKINTTMEHFKERLKMYEKAQFEYKLIQVNR